jgi:hypothetical protein
MRIKIMTEPGKGERIMCRVESLFTSRLANIITFTVGARSGAPTRRLLAGEAAFLLSE